MQPIIHNYRNKGDTWKKYHITSEQVRRRNQGIQNGSTTLWEYARQLIVHSEEAGYLLKKRT